MDLSGEGGSGGKKKSKTGGGPDYGDIQRNAWKGGKSIIRAK